MLLLTACTARELPPQLAYTPGPAYALTDKLLVTEAYTVETPLGWRVIAGPAEDPYTFQLITPDNTALIVISNRELSSPPTPAAAGVSALAVERAETRVAERAIFLTLVAEENNIEPLLPVLETVRLSIR